MKQITFIILAQNNVLLGNHGFGIRADVTLTHTTHLNITADQPHSSKGKNFKEPYSITSPNISFFFLSLVICTYCHCPTSICKFDTPPSILFIIRRALHKRQYWWLIEGSVCSQNKTQMVRLYSTASIFFHLPSSFE